MQVQGPMSAKTLEKLVGSAIYDIKYYWCENFSIEGIPVLISRTGWTAIPGFEVNLLDYSKGDALWDAIAGAGEEFGIKPIAPCEARRIEGGIFNYGSDMTLDDTPLHVMGLERLVEDQEQDYIGKAALEALKAKGVDRKLVGIEWEGQQLRAELSRVWDVRADGKTVGRMTDAVWSPGLQKNIGYAWVPIGLADPGTKLDVLTERGEQLTVMTSSIPFVDPKKQAPAAALG
jgi:aminomethyltransferase